MPIYKEYLNHTLGLTLSTPGLVGIKIDEYIKTIPFSAALLFLLFPDPRALSESTLEVRLHPDRKRFFVTPHYTDTPRQNPHLFNYNLDRLSHRKSHDNDQRKLFNKDTLQ